MKKISLYLLAGAMSLTACNNWLQEEPKSFDNGDIRTDTQAEARVNYLYRSGAPTQISSTGAYRGGNYSINNFLTGYYSSSYWGQETDFKEAADLTRQQNVNDVCTRLTQDIWTSCFRCINIANTAIKSISAMPEQSSAAKRLLAEAQFFRAFNYFHLVKIFGGVPLYTEPTENLENAYAERATAEAVYGQVIADLNAAIAALPDATMVDNNKRVGKTAAQTLLADVYMQKGDKAAAKTQLEAVVKSGKYDLLQNDDKGAGSYINKLRTQDNSIETIYFVEYNRDNSSMNRRTGNAFDGSMASKAQALGIYELVVAPTEAYTAIYPVNDLRIQNQQFFATEATLKVKSDGTMWTWKWDGETRGDWFYLEETCLYDGKGTKDWNIYRYAEVLLDYAECLGAAEGAQYLAKVQARANMDGKTVAQLTAELQGLNDTQFAEACWNERIKEFPLEYKLWDLCLRTKKFPVINGADNVTWVNLVGATNARGAQIKDSDLLWPVPVQEIQRNPNLTQNPGY